jgi:hypothetical protein
MVLIDSTEPATEPATAAPDDTDEADQADAAGSDDLLGRATTLAATVARLGVGRLYAQTDYGTLPPQSRDAVRDRVATTDTFRSTLDEYVAAGASVDQAAALQDFADKPLAVLTAGIGSDAAWIARHEELSTYSSNGVHRIIDGADHAGLILEEEPAADTTRAILDVVASVRDGEPLER